jgi:RimJ/RimL family protein N-acetyltransferase
MGPEMMACDGIRLVSLSRAHLERTRAWANDPELALLMNRAAAVSEPEHDAWFESISKRTDCAYFAIEREDDGHHIGNVWLWAIDDRHRKAELRIVIGEAVARGRGFGGAAIGLAARYGFERLHLHRIYAYVLAFNPGARRAFEKAGFLLEGTLCDDRWVGDRFVSAWLLSRVTSG